MLEAILTRRPINTCFPTEQKSVPSFFMMSKGGKLHKPRLLKKNKQSNYRWENAFLFSLWSHSHENNILPFWIKMRPTSRPTINRYCRTKTSSLCVSFQYQVHFGRPEACRFIPRERIKTDFFGNDRGFMKGHKRWTWHIIPLNPIEEGLGLYSSLVTLVLGYYQTEQVDFL